MLLQHWVYCSNGSYCCCTTKIMGLVLVFLSAMLDLVLDEWVLVFLSAMLDLVLDEWLLF